MDTVGPIAFQHLFAEIFHNFFGHLFQDFASHGVGLGIYEYYNNSIAVIIVLPMRCGRTERIPLRFIYETRVVSSLNGYRITGEGRTTGSCTVRVSDARARRTKTDDDERLTGVGDEQRSVRGRQMKRTLSE